MVEGLPNLAPRLLFHRGCISVSLCIRLRMLVSVIVHMCFPPFNPRSSLLNHAHNNTFSLSLSNPPFAFNMVLVRFSCVKHSHH